MLYHISHIKHSFQLKFDYLFFQSCIHFIQHYLIYESLCHHPHVLRSIHLTSHLPLRCRISTRSHPPQKYIIYSLRSQHHCCTLSSQIIQNHLPSIFDTITPPYPSHRYLRLWYTEYTGSDLWIYWFDASQEKCIDSLWIGCES
jgi:hypothetical protein